MPLESHMADKVMERSMQTQGSRKPCYYDDTRSARVSERIGIEREVCCTMIKEIYSGGLEMNMARCVNQCSLHSTIVNFLS